MSNFTLTPDMLAAFAGVVLSLLFSYVPGMNVWFAGLTGQVKRLIMLALLALVAGAIFGLGCAGIVSAGATCDNAGVVQIVWLFVLAMIGNQSMYLATPQTWAVRIARLGPLPEIIAGDDAAPLKQ